MRMQFFLRTLWLVLMTLLPSIQAGGSNGNGDEANGNHDVVQQNKQQKQQRQRQQLQSKQSAACSVCGAGMFVGHPEGSVVVSLASENSRHNTTAQSFSGFRSYPCGTLEELGFQGTIPLDICTAVLPDIVREPCKCQQQGDDANNNNNNAPSTVPMTGDSDYPFCSICGQGKSVDNQNAMVPQTSLLQSIVGRSSSSSSPLNTNMTCSELQLAGFEGYVSPNDCSNLYSTVVGPCQCASTNGNASRVWRSGVINIGVMLALFSTVIGIWLLRMQISNYRNRDVNNTTNEMNQNTMDDATSSLEDPEIRRRVLMTLFPEQTQTQKQQPTQSKQQQLNFTLKDGNNEDIDHDEISSKQQQKESLQEFDPESKEFHHQQQVIQNEDHDDTNTRVNEHAVCSICLEGIGLEDPVVNGIQCHHTFHRSCIFDWFTMEQAQHNDCPMCRRPMWDPEQYMAAVKEQKQEKSSATTTASYLYGFLFHS